MFLLCRGWRPRQPSPACCSTMRYMHNELHNISQHGTSTQIRDKTKPYRSQNGTSYFCKAEIAPLPYRFVKKCGQYSIFKLRSGCDIGYYALGCVYTKYQMHTHALTQVLYSLFQKRTSVSPSRRACTCPQVSKRFLLIPKITTFVA